MAEPTDGTAIETPNNEGVNPWQEQLNSLQEQVSQLALAVQTQNQTLSEAISQQAPRTELAALQTQLTETQEQLAMAKLELAELKSTAPRQTVGPSLSSGEGADPPAQQPALNQSAKKSRKPEKWL